MSFRSLKQRAKKNDPLLSLRQTAVSVARAHGVQEIALFGSYARGTQTEKSDIDLMVTMPRRSSLLDLVGLKLDLEKALKKNVDIIPSHCIKPILRESILAEAQQL